MQYLVVFRGFAWTYLPATSWGWCRFRFILPFIWHTRMFFHLWHTRLFLLLWHITIVPLHRLPVGVHTCCIIAMPQNTHSFSVSMTVGIRCCIRFSQFCLLRILGFMGFARCFYTIYLASLRLSLHAIHAHDRIYYIPRSLTA